MYNFAEYLANYDPREIIARIKTALADKAKRTSN